LIQQDVTLNTEDIYTGILNTN